MCDRHKYDESLLAVVRQGRNQRLQSERQSKRGLYEFAALRYCTMVRCPVPCEVSCSGIAEGVFTVAHEIRVFLFKWGLLQYS